MSGNQTLKMDFINWLDTNIEFEEILLDRIKNKSGALHKNYKTKLQQIHDLKATKNKQLNFY